jgi:hypothetical protein
MKYILFILSSALLACNSGGKNNQNDLYIDAPHLDTRSTAKGSNNSADSPKASFPISLQEVSVDAIYKKWGSALATEGLDISLNKSLYKAKEHVVLVYAGFAYIKINGRHEALEEASFKPTPNGFVEILKNKYYKLTIIANNIKYPQNYPLEGWSIINGTLNLIELKSMASLHQSAFYAEGLY